MSNNKDSIVYKQLFAGAAAGIASTIGTQPLDVLRVRLQSSASRHHHAEHALKQNFLKRTGTLLVSTYAKEGIHGLYRGLIPMLVAVVPSRSIYLTSYTQARDYLQNMFYPNDGLHQHRNHSWIHLTASTVAMMGTSTMLNPLFFVKTRMQLRGPNTLHQYQYRGYLDCIVQVYRKEGILAFYKGLTASYLGAIENGIYFIFYEQAKFSLLQHRFAKSNLPLEQFDEFKKLNLSAWDFFTLSASCKLLASLLTYPHEVLKTRMREVDQQSGSYKYSSIRNAVSRIWREEGWRTFYTGMEAHLLRTVPNTAITFLIFEFLMTFFETANK